MNHSLKLLITTSLLTLSNTWGAGQLPEGNSGSVTSSTMRLRTVGPQQQRPSALSTTQLDEGRGTPLRPKDPDAADSSMSKFPASSLKSKNDQGDDDLGNRDDDASGTTVTAVPQHPSTPLVPDSDTLLDLAGLPPDQQQVMRALVATFHQQKPQQPIATSSSPNAPSVAAATTLTGEEASEDELDPNDVLEEMLRAFDKVAFPTDERAPNTSAQQDAVHGYQLDIKQLQMLYNALPPKSTMVEQRRFDSLQARYRETITSYLNEVLEYKPYSASKITIVFNIFVTVICTVAHFLLAFDSWGYKALPPFAGGSTFYLCTQFLQTFPEYLYAKFWDETHRQKTHIKEVWGKIIELYHDPLIELLTYTLLKSGKVLLPFQLKEALGDALNNSSRTFELYEALQ